jgi:hypothetical protein
MKYFNKLVLGVLIFLSISNISVAQKKEIIGKITDESGNPIPFTSIAVKGKKGLGAGTWSNKDGVYVINLPNDADTIICSHVNFSRKSEKIDGNTIINFVLSKHIPLQSTVSISGTHKYTPQVLSDRKQNDSTRIDSDNTEYKVFTKVQVDAYFLGGSGAFQSYLKKEIVYPDSATISDVKGIVKVGYTIDKNGMPKNIILIKGVNKFTDEIVLAAIKKMPKWKPANQNGRLVDQYKEISVSFDIVGKEN